MSQKLFGSRLGKALCKNKTYLLIKNLDKNNKSITVIMSIAT